jgi:hypothetical protein
MSAARAASTPPSGGSTGGGTPSGDKPRQGGNRHKSK